MPINRSHLSVKAELSQKMLAVAAGNAKKSLEKQLDAVIELSAKSTYRLYFRFKEGVFIHSSLGLRPAKLADPPRLIHESARPAMLEYLKAREELDKQLEKAANYLVCIWCSPANSADYLKIFPSSLHGPIKELFPTRRPDEGNLSEEDIASLRSRANPGLQILFNMMAADLLF